MPTSNALRAELTASFNPDKPRIFVCMGTGLQVVRRREILEAFQRR